MQVYGRAWGCAMITKALLMAGALLAMSGSVSAKEYPERMEFSEFQPCSGTASFCHSQHLARGILDDGAPDRLHTGENHE